MENKNAFKHWINEQVVHNMAKSIRIHYPEFDSGSFIKLTPRLKNLELKDRVLELTRELRTHLPQDYRKTLKILTQVMTNSELKGFSLWPVSEYIAQFGVEHFHPSMQAMEILTEKFTAEFAIRPFLLNNPQQVLEHLDQKTSHPSVHIRRWISEGTRPYLPWGAKIPQIAENPQWTLKILEKLKYDDELYVRKSVANHLNDHSKKHPNLVVEILKRWEKECPEKHLSKIHWIKRHALRTLIKQGFPGALKLMGVDQKIKVNVSEIKLNKKRLNLGDSLCFEFEIQSTGSKEQKLIIDYVIDFLKSNGKHGSKVFKLKSILLAPKERVVIKKSHPLRKITTMKYYSGRHQLSIQINGNKIVQKTWLFNC